MLSSIKDKLLNVTKTVPLFSTNSDRGHVQCEVNSNAGSEILSHYQAEWQALHNQSEQNAKKAEEAATEIAKITNKIERDKKSLSVMTHLLAHSNLNLNLVNCTKQIEKLYDSFREVEEELVQLEDLIETVEFENMKKQHRYHLQQYKVRKEESLKAFEASLKEKHEKAVAEFDLKKKKELEERQQVFHEAFKSDLEIYKNSGTIPKLDLPKKQPSALLEEIQVDFDESELDQFLSK
ncbi:dysbindin [Tribolium castaneum]|uniref:Dysbindin-like Protein n=1 Tax=Tribolium castaneum TaxID=7070 RepID=D6WRY9_TRICA|nr:PREDICTED: dysbindin [Tribolium castaneum]EFA06602.1 Dysbindin-like Protein [Tribolium castaneum]|eukprot:XP_976168.1 PREDICTED: dysbindin [Tribolium castaneum]